MKGIAMRPLTLPNIVALAAGQALALVAGCASTYAVWLWLVAAQPFK
jgi:hypothetical protein